MKNAGIFENAGKKTAPGLLTRGGVLWISLWFPLKHGK
jgi:hypothetical protein